MLYSEFFLPLSYNKFISAYALDSFSLENMINKNNPIMKILCKKIPTKQAIATIILPITVLGEKSPKPILSKDSKIIHKELK